MAEQIPREQFSAWANIPARVLFDREISDRAKLLYGLISCMSNSYGFAFAKNSTLMRYLNVEERSLQRTLKHLKLQVLSLSSLNVFLLNLLKSSRQKLLFQPLALVQALAAMARFWFTKTCSACMTISRLSLFANSQKLAQ